MNKKLPIRIPYQSAHTNVLQAYGLFMVAWSVLESVIQSAIQKELGVNALKAVIVTGKMQFNPRAQLLISLLKLHGDKHKEAIRLLQRAEGYAKRNSLVHGLIQVDVPNALTFIKYDGGASDKLTYTAEELTQHLLEVNERTEKLQKLLNLSNSDLQAIGDATLEFAKQS